MPSNGGAIYSESGNLSIQSSTIDGNSTRHVGGGIATVDGDVALSDTPISNNQSSLYGGGIGTHLLGVAAIRLERSTVEANLVIGDPGRVGGVAARGPLTLVDSAIVNNRMTGLFAEGGGISSAQSDVSITNSTISGNHATGQMSEGGAISKDFGSLTLINSTVTGNRVGGQHGSFQLGSAVSLQTDLSIIAGNVTPNLGRSGRAQSGEVEDYWITIPHDALRHDLIVELGDKVASVSLDDNRLSLSDESQTLLDTPSSSQSNLIINAAINGEIQFDDPPVWRMGPTSVFEGRFRRTATQVLHDTILIGIEAPSAWQNAVQASDVDNKGFGLLLKESPARSHIACHEGVNRPSIHRAPQETKTLWR